MPRDTKYQAGDLRQTVAIERSYSKQDATGQPVESWRAVTGSSAIPASVMPLRGREAFRYTQVDATLTHKVVIRSSTEANTKRRIRWGNRVLNIRQSFDPDNRNQWVECICSEAVNG